MNFKNSKASLGKRILYPILVMVLFQIMIFWLFVFQLGLFDSVIKQAKTGFLSAMINHAQMIDTEMWIYHSDLSPLNNSVSQLRSQFRSISPFTKKDKKMELAPALLSEILMNSSSLHADAIFIELYQPNGDKDHFLLRIDQDLVSKKVKMSSAEYDTYILSLLQPIQSPYLQDTPFATFLNHMEYVNRKENAASMYDRGNWSPLVHFDELEYPSLVFAIPLMNKDQQFGSIGTVVSIHRFNRFLAQSNFQDDFPYQAILLRHELSNDELEIIGNYSANTDPIIQDNATEIVNLLGQNFDSSTQYTTTVQINRKKYMISVQTLLNVSLPDAPFSTSNFHLVFLAPEDTIFQSVTILRQTFLFLIILFVLLSVIVGFFITKQVVSPINMLTSAIRRREIADEHKALPMTEIAEIDLLTSTISTQEQSIKDFHQMITDTMIASESNMVTFYIDTENEKVSGFGTFQSLLGDAFPQDYLLSLSYEEFKIRLDNLFLNYELYSRSINDDSNTTLATDIYLDRNSHKYICVKTRDLEKGKTIIMLDYTNYILDQEKIKKERDYDILTSLLNRLSFTKKAKEYLECFPSSPVAMAMWDLDYLKLLNDTYGHDVGDLYLRTAGKILSQADSERSFVSRVSGDEFFVFFFNYGSKQNFVKAIQTIHEKLNSAYIILPDDTKHSMSASCGYAYSTSATYEELKKRADSAMYVSKRSEKGSIHEYTD